MLEPAIALFLQQGTTTTGVLRFFAAFLLILTIYTSAWLFTYWISKDE